MDSNLYYRFFMTRIILSIGIAAGLLTSCGKDITKDIEALADKACACKEVECARGVITGFMKLVEDNTNAKGDEKRAAAATERLSTCVIEAGLRLSELVEMGEKLSAM